MIHIHKIMVPVDFSEPSKKAVNYALSLALQFDSRLILAYIGGDLAKYESSKADLLELIPAECREVLNFEIIVKYGDVRAELIGIIEDRQVDLVVMGTHGRPYFERLLLGSVTDRVLRKVHVPIMTVAHLNPEKEIHKPGAVPLQRILYATDFSNGSEDALQFSVRLAHGFDASLLVAHVIQPSDAMVQGLQAAAYLPTYAEGVRARAEEQLARTVALVSDGSVPVTTALVEGVPYEAINALAEQHQADLIVLNVRSKGVLERAILGTTAERVIRTARVPVLSLPLPATYASRWAAA